MANSARYNKLKSRIKFIENNLLPDEKITGNYTKKEKDLIRGYILLVHAEIEAYFEDIAKQVVSNAKSKWIATRQKSNCILSIIAFCSHEINWENDPSKNDIKHRINRTTGHYTNKLNSNHGIKSNNVKNILLPLGIEESQLDQTWLNTMDDFGAKRGSIAHSTHSVQNPIDLKTEKDRINIQIIPEIKDLDSIIKALK
ncbi:HEPN domain-containing protein [Maribacter stanieri]|uniref:RiboL-PSP-HEPN domain-containing protein n=1 Tax=Maribacter stanieri TaxID=440514 RepID=A0A1I6K3N7_9FLAO|nr:HEPN domain-containing protein [Maribacter stanieri]SFR85440.1 hypothetical protein SAMN04488010_3412 [Maribacter stanieri]